MSKIKDDKRLQDITECIKRIEQYVNNMSYDAFLEDIKTQDAVIRNLEIIGEAVKALSSEIREQNNNISWSEIARLRDKLIHHYFGINFDILWAIIQEDIPVFKNQVEKL